MPSPFASTRSCGCKSTGGAGRFSVHPSETFAQRFASAAELSSTITPSRLVSTQTQIRGSSPEAAACTTGQKTVVMATGVVFTWSYAEAANWQGKPQESMTKDPYRTQQPNQRQAAASEQSNPGTPNKEQVLVFSAQKASTQSDMLARGKKIKHRSL